MSAVHGIAWGLVELTGENFRFFRRGVRKELRTHRITLRPTISGQYSLSSAGKKSGHRLGRAYLGHGDLKRCCELASKIITPSNPER